MRPVSIKKELAEAASQAAGRQRSCAQLAVLEPMLAFQAKVSASSAESQHPQARNLRATVRFARMVKLVTTGATVQCVRLALTDSNHSGGAGRALQGKPLGVQERHHVLMFAVNLQKFRTQPQPRFAIEQRTSAGTPMWAEAARLSAQVERAGQASRSVHCRWQAPS